jgi:mRNA interferase HicA
MVGAAWADERMGTGGSSPETTACTFIEHRFQPLTQVWRFCAEGALLDRGGRLMWKAVVAGRQRGTVPLRTFRCECLSRRTRRARQQIAARRDRPHASEMGRLARGRVPRFGNDDMPQQMCCNSNTSVVFYHLVTSGEFKRWLQKMGCTFEAGHGSHLTVRLGTKTSVLPMHGKQKELGTGLVRRIKKDLGLK